MVWRRGEPARTRRCDVRARVLALAGFVALAAETNPAHAFVYPVGSRIGCIEKVGLGSSRQFFPLDLLGDQSRSRGMLTLKGSKDMSSLDLPPLVATGTRMDEVESTEYTPEGVGTGEFHPRIPLVALTVTMVMAGAIVFLVYHGSHPQAIRAGMGGWAGLPPAPTLQLHPLRSIVTGAGAGLTRAVSRVFTFPLDTVKTRQQVSRMSPENKAAMPEEMRKVMEAPTSRKGVFRGFTAFLLQAGPSNAVFYLFYEALNELGLEWGGAVMRLVRTAVGGGGAVVGGGGLNSWMWPAAVHLVASSLATIPSNLVRTPAEVVKQRLQVGLVSGNSLSTARSIVKEEGLGGLFVGVSEQLAREIPFNAIQFTVYECLKAYFPAALELWADALLGATSSASAAFATQPIDTVKTRVMTKSVPGIGMLCGDSRNQVAALVSPGILRSLVLVAKSEGLSSLYLGLLPRLVLVSVGGAFYFWGQELVRHLLSSAGL